MLIFAIVAFGAGLIRGFTGFGGPAFILAILTLFFPPISIVAKIFVADFLTSIYLFSSSFKQIQWRQTWLMVVPTFIGMPVGQWLLIELDPAITKQIMAIIIAGVCLLLLSGYRYKKPLTPLLLVLLGFIAGVVFGGSYIALIAVTVILLGPYDKNEGRTLIVAWAFFAVVGYAISASLAGTIHVGDFQAALPGAASYLFGAWVGSLYFHRVSEKIFRRAAIGTLFIIAIVNLVQ